MEITTSVPNNYVFRLETFIDEKTAISLYKDIYNSLAFIKNGENHKISFEFLYRSCYKLTLNRYGGMLYGGILEFLISMLRNEFVFNAKSLNDIIYDWNKYESILNTLNDILMYLEKNFIIPNIKIPMKKIGMCIFCKYYLFEKDKKSDIFNFLYKILTEFRKSGNTEQKFSNEVRIIINKLYDLPSIEIDTKYLQNNSIDTINLNDTYCNYCIKDQIEYITFKSRHPIFCENALNDKNDKTMLFTFRYNIVLPSLDWNDHMMFRIFFEYPFLSKTRELYSKESEELLSINEDKLFKICNYLFICEKRYFEEKRLVENYLFYEVWNNLVKEMDSVWILSFCDNYFNENNNNLMFDFFSSGRREDLQRLFKIMSRVPNCLLNLKLTLKKYVSLHLSEIFSSIGIDFTENEYIKCMQGIETLKSRCEYIIQECFFCNQNFNQIIIHSFEDFLQKQDFELINNWIVLGFDTFLRKNALEATNTIEKQIEILIWLFKFISNKEDFETKYRNLLCKRTLEFPENNNNIEHSIIVKFKNECGNGYTLRLEGVLSDLMQSELTNSEYNQSSTKKNSKLNIKFYLLTSNYWLLPPFINCTVSSEITDHLKEFEQFYCTKYEKRRLQWHFGVGNATISSSIKLKNTLNLKFTFNCSTLQMFILNIFNNYDYISFHEIQNIIECSDINALKKSLFGLSREKDTSILKFLPINEWEEIVKFCNNLDKTKGKFYNSFDKIKKLNSFIDNNLKCIPSPTVISEEDIFCINFNVDVELILTKKNFCYQYDELSNDQNQIFKFERGQFSVEDKAHLVDSIIIKVLKKNKTLNLDDIISKTLDGSCLLTNEHTDLVIERIESLCKKEFISKDPNSKNLFNYIP
ncbi:hypothetical protein FG386_003200 [Cryptosporidium ryanae]|uniref:uncharacterized protein n=1 Tax=Cryptosporidium ryanae TaxID=515981 RepID=UPI00351A9415|nr:hypothetical protein FG386_003200 [Cryptosporidium ryanae]